MLFNIYVKLQFDVVSGLWLWCHQYDMQLYLLFAIRSQGGSGLEWVRHWIKGEQAKTQPQEDRGTAGSLDSGLGSGFTLMLDQVALFKRNKSAVWSLLGPKSC